LVFGTVLFEEASTLFGLYLEASVETARTSVLFRVLLLGGRSALVPALDAPLAYISVPIPD
jgi:hypothetical protein